MTNDAEKHLPFEEPNGEFERKVQRMENVKKRKKGRVERHRGEGRGAAKIRAGS